MSIRGVRYFSGSVGIRVYGGFTENFINDCAKNNIEIWDIRSINGSVFFFTTEKYINTVAELAESSGLSVQVSSKVGLPYIIRRNKSHYVLMAGLVIALIFVALMNTRIWVIDVSGNERLFDSEILEIMEEYGVMVGARKSKIDAVEIQKMFLERKKDDVLWVSLNVEGMCAEIQIREIERVEDDTIGQPCNYVADFNGVITTYRVFSGTPVVNKGDYVRRGDMLISSVVEYYDEELNFVESRGLVIARRNKYVNKKADINSEKRSFLYTENRFSLIAFGAEIPLSINRTDKQKETVSDYHYLRINGVRLPFGIAVHTDSFYENTNEDGLNKLHTLKNYITDIETQTCKSNVISVKTVADNATSVYELKGEIDCLDFMGRKETVNYENVG